MFRAEPPNRSAFPRTALTASLAVLLGACGGGGDAPPPPSQPPVGRLSAVLVAPESTAVSAAAAASGSHERATALAATGCGGIPAGYTPVAAATVTLLDAAGATVASGITTDACGRFDRNDVPAGAATVRFQPPGALVAVQVPIANVGDRDSDGLPDPVSTFPTGASLLVGNPSVEGTRLAFTLRDSVSGKAVLGVPASAVTLRGAGGALAISQFTYAGLNGEPARVIVALDASGSMGGSVPGTAPAGGRDLTRFAVAGAAARLFIDRVGASDRVGAVAFDNIPDFLGPAFFGTTWTGRIVDSSGSAVALSFEPDGFTGDKRTLGILADFYNRDSDSWKVTTAPVRFTGRSHPWGGSTAVWDAISLGIDRIGTGGRRFILAMTDGNDNASRIRVADLTAKARAAGVPVHTVGIGSATSVDVTDLTTVSTATGGTFTLIDSNALQAKLAATLDAIRTGIQFQYGGTLATPAAAGAALTLEVSHGGLTGQASLTAAAAGGN